MTYVNDCEVCGEPLEDGHSDHSADAVVIRDGARGQYLTPTFAFDVADLAGEDKLPEDLRRIAGVWLDGMGAMSAPDPTPDETDALLHWTTYQAADILADAGFVTVWDDGYVIYKTSI